MRATTDGSTFTQGENHPISTRTTLTLAWAFATLLWSIFTPPKRTYAARIVLFQPVWVLRIVGKDLNWLQDLVTFEILHAVYSHSTGAWHFISEGNRRWLDVTDPTTRLCVQISSLLAVCSVLAGSIVYRGHHLKAKQDLDEPPYGQRIDEQVLPPLLFPSKTAHSRMFPRKHSFGYSYLLVGIPIGVRGRISTVLSVDSQQRGWFVVNPADYLDRGVGQFSLAEKLKRYLHTQGVTDRDYAFAYLVTAPRFLGYSFNPVSFWYLYDSDTQLRYMILEVNNTFGERRMYLLESDGTKHQAEDDPTRPSNGKTTNTLVFSEVWEKDFHVSPFNSRKGSYSLKAVDPLAASQEAGHVRIDNTIVLRSSKDHAKLVARVWSEGQPKDPTHISTYATAQFILAWSWVGFATFPRIVWQASKLFFRRKLHVWYRPEVAGTSLGRAYTSEEQHLEAFFRAFLTCAVTESHKPLRVIYEPAHSAQREVVLYSPGYTYEEDHKRTLTIKVLSPAFYSRFVHYAHAKEAFDRECLATDEKNQTARVERADLLPVLLGAIRRMEEAAVAGQRMTLPMFEQIRWAWLRRLRCPPAPVSYPEKHEFQITDIRSCAHSELDRFVLGRRDDSDVYRRTVTKVFLAQRFAFGIPPVVTLLDLTVRSMLLLASMIFSDRSDAIDILRPRKLDGRDVVTALITPLLANAVHLWNFVKG